MPISVEPLKNAREFQQSIYFCFIHYAPPSMGLSRQEYWSGLPFPSPGDLPNPGMEPWSLILQADTLLSEPPGNKLINLIPDSSAFSKSSLCIWKFSVHVLLKPVLKDFEHYLLACEMGTLNLYKNIERHFKEPGQNHSNSNILLRTDPWARRISWRRKWHPIPVFFVFSFKL